jgi:SAM-dependent methyltransferase
MSDIRATREEATEKLRTRIVRGWESVFKKTYEGSVTVTGPSFVGWNSSYTGQQIPEPEMQEWLTSTVEQLTKLRPRRVLEIGCGVGLLLQHLAPQCEVYVGTDFSAAAIAQAQQWLSKRDDLRHVELLHRTATEVHNLTSTGFDTIVLNSVAQYFPDVDYFIAVLQAAIRLLAQDGNIFVGDVRHLEYLPTFHSAVQLSKAAATLSVRQLRNRIARMASQDNELVLDPQLFRLLVGRLPGISAVNVLLKRGRARNELTHYRYDVLLKVGEHPDDVVICDRLDWTEAVGSLSQLESALKHRRWSAACLIGIPNERVAKEVAGRRLIETSDEQLEVGVLRQQLNELDVQAVDPETLWQLAEAHNYEATVTPSERGLFDVQLLDRFRIHEVPRTALYSQSSTTPWSAYANKPFKHSLGL